MSQAFPSSRAWCTSARAALVLSIAAMSALMTGCQHEARTRVHLVEFAPVEPVRDVSFASLGAGDMLGWEVARQDALLANLAQVGATRAASGSERAALDVR